MKSPKHIVIAICMPCFFMAACKKDDPQPSPTWWDFGAGNTVTEIITPISALFFYSGKTVRVFDGADTTLAAVNRGEGTYSILGRTVAAKCTYFDAGGTFSATGGAVNAGFTFLEGTWGTRDNTSGSGRYFVVKQ